MLVDDNSGTLTKYLNGMGIDNKLRVQTGSDVRYFLADHLGSTNGLADNLGNLTASTNYDAFGNATNASFPSRYQFTGREHDNFTGLHYYRARFYDANLGRFISEDPIGFTAGDINLYGYVWNNSISFRDPSGKIVPIIAAGVIIGAGALILSSPSYVNAPAPGDPVYDSRDNLVANGVLGLAGGYVGSRILGAIASKFCRIPIPEEKILWGSWDDYGKTIVDGNEYAQVGNRLFSRHATDRMQPSGNRYWTGGQGGGMPQFRQTGGGYDYGRGVAPQFVEDAISTSRGVLQPNGNISHTSGSLQIILNQQGNVVK